MLSFNEFLTELFDTFSPLPVDFGTNVDFFGER